MSAASPIRSVSVLSTGRVSIRPEHVGPTWKPQTLWLLTSSRWTAPLPINVYVIEHEHGLVLFDTGQDRASVTDPRYFPAGILGRIYDRLARFEIAPGDTLTAQLAAAGYRAGDVSIAVLSHLHQDHIGGLGELANATIVASADELATLDRPAPAMRGLLLDHIRLPGLTWSPVALTALRDASLSPFTLGHDLFGDGSLVLLPTPGHTPGSLSMLVRRDGRAPLLLVGDLTYDVDLMTSGGVPGSGDQKRMRRSSELVAELATNQPGLVVLAAHDPTSAERLAAAR
jgi:N-acyl homoserine lactone hydrolase